MPLVLRSNTEDLPGSRLDAACITKEAFTRLATTQRRNKNPHDDPPSVRCFGGFVSGPEPFWLGLATAF